MADFKIALNKTLQNEGKYVNDPSDSGGETYCGISRKNFPKWEGWIIIDSYSRINFPKCLDQDTKLQGLVSDFYYHNFWLAAGCDKLNNQEIANHLFDSAVNMGIKPAVKLVQESLFTTVTGVLDKTTIEKLNQLS
jgi:lysozyme family protein